MRPYSAFGTILLLILLLASCSNNPYRQAQKSHYKQIKELNKLLKIPRVVSFSDSLNSKDAYVVESINFNLRKPNLVVIHHTAQDSCAQTLKTFTIERSQVSSHYVICKDGTITQMLSDYVRGWHAGRGSWGTITDVNSLSIGIELDNNGNEPFPEEQINSLLLLLNSLKLKFRIPEANFIAHADMAPTRKNDPSKYFPWEQLAEDGYGIWYDKDGLISPPEYFSPELALKLIGYNVTDLSAAIRAFELRFSSEDIDGQLSEKELEILYALTRK